MKYVLAPIAGFTNAAFRLMASRGGADLTYTEMVSAAGLAHGSSPTRHLLEVLPGEGPVACQLFGANPDELAFAAREVSATGRFVELNLNAGCPVPRIVREGAGSALVKDPARVHDLLVAMVGATDLPVTLKTRPGPRPDKVLMLELLDAAETAGAKGITLHARFTSQNHGGAVHLDLLAELVQKGRAALPNPYIFSALNPPSPRLRRTSPQSAFAEATADKSSTLFREHLEALKALHAQIVAHFPQDRLPTLDAWVAGAVRTHLFRYFAGRPGVGELRRRLATIRTLREIAIVGLEDF